jgi:CRP-like cAMP-binding protein
MSIPRSCLDDLAPSDRETILGLSETALLPSGTAFIRAGEHPGALFLLSEGTASVRVERSGNVFEINRVAEGAVLGEMSLLSGDAATATVVALGDCRVARIAQGVLAAHGLADPGFSARLYQSLARVVGERLQRANAALLSRTEGESFVAVPWQDTLAAIRAIELPPLVLGWIERYSAVGHRGMFLWKWCWRGLEETELACVPPEARLELRSTKLVCVILNVLLDDLADVPGQEERFHRARNLLTHELLMRPDAPIAVEEDPYLRLVQEVWQFIAGRLRLLDRWEHYLLMWEFDEQQVVNAMRYAALINRYPMLDNLAENRAHLPHNVNLMPFAIMDLMASSSDTDDLGMVRESAFHAQSWGQIGNMLATWRREVPDRDFSSRVFALALETGVITRAELVSLPAEAILARIEASPVEALLLQECREHRDRLVTVARRCRSIDLAAYARGIEAFFGMNLAARGFI